MNAEEMIRRHNCTTLAFYRTVVRSAGKLIQLDSYKLFDNKFDSCEMVQIAFLCNQKITKIGTNKLPYMLHPIRVALLINDLVDDSSSIKESLLVAALLHDCIEEGDGAVPDIYKELQILFPKDSAYPKYSVLLTEPPIPSCSRLNKYQYYVQKKALVEQIINSTEPFLINVLLADLLDSLICYLFNNSTYKNVNTITALINYVQSQYQQLIHPSINAFITDIMNNSRARDKLCSDIVANEQKLFCVH